MAEINLESSAVVVGRDRRTGELMRLRFTGAEDAVNVLMPVALAPLLIQQIHKAAGHRLLRTATDSELKPGAVFQPLGQEVGRRPDGTFRLTLHIRTDDGDRSIPIMLTPDDAAHIVRLLSDS